LGQFTKKMSEDKWCRFYTDLCTFCRPTNIIALTLPGKSPTKHDQPTSEAPA